MIPEGNPQERKLHQLTRARICVVSCPPLSQKQILVFGLRARFLPLRVRSDLRSCFGWDLLPCFLPAATGLLLRLPTFLLVASYNGKEKYEHFSICACHPCAGAMLIFSVSFQF